MSGPSARVQATTLRTYYLLLYRAFEDQYHHSIKMAEGSISRNPSRTIVVFGGSISDSALATDFIAILKTLTAHGLNPTCLAGTHLLDVMELLNFPLVFGREDMGPLKEVYTHQEARNPFYQLASPDGLKKDVLDWIRHTARTLRVGDRMTVILVGHGWKNGSIKLTTRGHTEVLSRSEVVVSLSLLPQNVRVTIINEACYSGPWGRISSEGKSGAHHDILTETSCREDETAWKWYSSSGKFRCSLFAMAWLREITTHPEGRITQHISRIEEEMDFVPPHQETSKPTTTTSARSLRSHNFSHFILPPNIAMAVSKTASDQNAHEDMLRSRGRARQLWGSLWKSVGGRQGPATSAADSADPPNTVDQYNESDMELAIINEYLDDLGTLAQSSEKSPLANMCVCVLEGGGAAHDMKTRVVKTILWQEEQILRVDELLEHLITCELIAFYFEPDDAASALVDYKEDVATMLDSFFQITETFDGLQSPRFEDGYVTVHYPDAFQHLVDVLTCNKLLNPKSFNLTLVQSEVASFLRQY